MNNRKKKTKNKLYSTLKTSTTVNCTFNKMESNCLSLTTSHFNINNSQKVMQGWFI